MYRCGQLARLGVGLWFIAVWQLQTLQGTIEALPLPVYDGIVPCKQHMDWHDGQNKCRQGLALPLTRIAEEHVLMICWDTLLQHLKVTWTNLQENLKISWWSLPVACRWSSGGTPESTAVQSSSGSVQRVQVCSGSSEQSSQAMV